ncbi:MAG: hypothetical protein PHE16_03005 [Aliarcobacter sp.]|nr:hypothetical protein [Aliarcobacter sp.]
MGFGIMFLIPMFFLFMICMLSVKVIKILIENEKVKLLVNRIGRIFKNPQNVRDLCLGLFINAIYGLNTEVSLYNVLLSIICFCGIMLSNETIERNKK